VPLALILLFAAADPPAVEAIDYRLPMQEAAPRITDDCRRGAGEGEIIVCGRRGQGQRLEELKGRPEWEGRKPGEVVGIDLPFGRLEPEVTQVVRQDGFVDKRAMVTLKIPF